MKHKQEIYEEQVAFWKKQAEEQQKASEAIVTEVDFKSTWEDPVEMYKHELEHLNCVLQQVVVVLCSIFICTDWLITKVMYSIQAVTKQDVSQVTTFLCFDYGRRQFGQILNKLVQKV